MFLGRFHFFFFFNVLIRDNFNAGKDGKFLKKIVVDVF